MGALRESSLNKSQQEPCADALPNLQQAIPDKTLAMDAVHIAELESKLAQARVEALEKERRTACEIPTSSDSSVKELAVARARQAALAQAGEQRMKKFSEAVQSCGLYLQHLARTGRLRNMLKPHRLSPHSTPPCLHPLLQKRLGRPCQLQMLGHCCQSRSSQHPINSKQGKRRHPPCQPVQRSNLTSRRFCRKLRDRL